jgi:hypothetical protein
MKARFFNMPCFTHARRSHFNCPLKNAKAEIKVSKKRMNYFLQIWTHICRIAATEFGLLLGMYLPTHLQLQKNHIETWPVSSITACQKSATRSKVFWGLRVHTCQRRRKNAISKPDFADLHNPKCHIWNSKYPFSKIAN